MILRKAEDMRVEYEKAYWRAMMASVQTGVARAFKKT